MAGSEHSPLSVLEESLRGPLDRVRGFSRLLVACSGGADSTALALLVRDAAARAGDDAPEVLLGHVHHGIRGAEADADSTLVESLGRSLGKRVLVERLSPGRASETEARERRLDVFRRWAREHALDAILLAHHRDDQHETILLRICRGTGVEGLTGISAMRPLHGAGRATQLWRPLLEVTRAELRAFLETRGRCYRHDSMNDDLSVPRNRVRHEVLPLLEEHVHPGVRGSLDRLCAQAARVESGLSWIGGLLYQRALVEEVDLAIALRADVLLDAPDTVRRSILRHAERRLEPGSPTRLSEGRMSLLNRLLDTGSEPRGRLDLGGGLEVEVSAGRVSLRRPAQQSVGPASSIPDSLELRIDAGELDWRGWGLRASSSADWRPSADPLEEWIDEQALGGPLRVRSRREGDRFWPLGSSGHKKLKEFLRERGVEREARDRLPVVTAGDEIVWVVGERISHGVRLQEETVRAIRLSARTLPA